MQEHSCILGEKKSNSVKWFGCLGTEVLSKLLFRHTYNVEYIRFIKSQNLIFRTWFVWRKIRRVKNIFSSHVSLVAVEKVQRFIEQLHTIGQNSCNSYTSYSSWVTMSIRKVIGPPFPFSDDPLAPSCEENIYTPLLLILCDSLR